MVPAMIEQLRIIQMNERLRRGFCNEALPILQYVGFDMDPLNAIVVGVEAVDGTVGLWVARAGMWPCTSN